MRLQRWLGSASQRKTMFLLPQAPGHQMWGFPHQPILQLIQAPATVPVRSVGHSTRLSADPMG